MNDIQKATLGICLMAILITVLSAIFYWLGVKIL